MEINKRTEIIAIIGSRTPDKESSDLVRALVGPRMHSRRDCIYISGGCPTGADHWCRYFCTKWGLKYLEAPALWNSPLGKGAGPFRNELIVDICTKVLAFWDGKSAGTNGTIEYAKQIGRPVEIVTV